jgi:hypothetical protein
VLTAARLACRRKRLCAPLLRKHALRKVQALLGLAKLVAHSADFRP